MMQQEFVIGILLLLTSANDIDRQLLVQLVQLVRLALASPATVRLEMASSIALSVNEL